MFFGQAEYESTAHEESPGSTGQGAGQFPVKATLRKVQQKRKPPQKGKDEKAR